MSFELLVFTADPDRARLVTDAGADAVIVDWENRGKRDRQAAADTQINFDTPADLERVRRAIRGSIICRINSPGPELRAEVETAIACGADEILLPMVRREAEALEFIETINGRCRAGILIETRQAVAIAARLGVLPLHRIYVGLNDLAISMGAKSIFASLADGTVDSFRDQIHSPFGIGGLTRPDRGRPIPCRLLLGEIIRLRASFTFLRRSFWADTEGRNLTGEIRAIRDAVRAARLRTPDQVLQDRNHFLQAVEPILSRAV